MTFDASVEYKAETCYTIQSFKCANTHTHTHSLTEPPFVLLFVRFIQVFRLICHPPVDTVPPLFCLWSHYFLFLRLKTERGRLLFHSSMLYLYLLVLLLCVVIYFLFYGIILTFYWVRGAECSCAIAFIFLGHFEKFALIHPLNVACNIIPAGH